MSRFARIPEEVLSDPKLSSNDIRVYAALALHVFDGSIAALGQRQLSELTNLPRMEVRDSLNALATAGHISVAVAKLSRRSVFQLNHPVFHQKAALALSQPEDAYFSKPKTTRLKRVK